MYCIQYARCLLYLHHKVAAGVHCKEDTDLCIPRNELRGFVPSFHIHVPVSDLYIPTIGPPVLLQQQGRSIVGIHKLLTDTRM